MIRNETQKIRQAGGFTQMVTIGMTTNSRNIRWYGQNVASYECPLVDLPGTLPEFSRHRFGLNEYLDVIVREPFGDDQREIPVASVSRKYGLIQHTEAAKWFLRGVSDAGLQPDSMNVSVLISQYGERVSFRLNLPAFGFDPGDGHEIEPILEVTNSVDKSTPLIIRMVLMRLICDNGMATEQKAYLRIIHSKNWMYSKDVSIFIEEQLGSVRSLIDIYRAWLEIPIEIEDIREWIDLELAKKWGVTNAARFYSIISSGYDGKLGKNTHHRLPTERPISQDQKVPGAFAPITNAYHALQALSWIASRMGSIEKSSRMRQEVIPVFDSLLNAAQPSDA